MAARQPSPRFDAFLSAEIDRLAAHPTTGALKLARDAWLAARQLQVGGATLLQHLGLFLRSDDGLMGLGMVGLVLAGFVGMVILGGVKRIARVASTLVPFMAMLYIAAALIVLIGHADAIPAAFATIFNHALTPWAVGGAAVYRIYRGELGCDRQQVALGYNLYPY